MESNTTKVRDTKLEPKDGTNQPKNKLERQAGIDGDDNFYKVPQLNVAPCETVLKGKYGSHIGLGVDRLNSLQGRKFGSGLGMDGHFGSAALDMVAGLGSSEQMRNRVPDVPVNPDVFRDAARVYLSQNCNVDEQFQISDGTIGNIRNKSTVAMKADQLRMWANEGIKIGTGAGINSKGRKVVSVPPIDLMPGNTPPEMMQPLVRGRNMQAALNEVIDRMNQLMLILDDYMYFQQIFNNVLAFHDHYDPLAMGAGIIAGIGPTGYFGGRTAKSPKCMDAGAKMGVAMTTHLQPNVTKWLIGLEGTRAEYLWECMTKHINSRHTNTG